MHVLHWEGPFVLVQTCILTVSVCHATNCLQTENKYYKSTPLFLVIHLCKNAKFQGKTRPLPVSYDSSICIFLIKLLETVTNACFPSSFYLGSAALGIRWPSSREPSVSPKQAIPWHLSHFITYRICVCVKRTMLKTRYRHTLFTSLWPRSSLLALTIF